MGSGDIFKFHGSNKYTDTVNVDPLQVLGSTDKFCFIPYANSTSQVWDPGRQLSWNSYIVETTETRIVGVEITGISPPKEEELIVSVYGILEQRRAQITTHLTGTSQNQLVRLLSPAPTVPILHSGLLVAEYIMFGSRYAIGEITGSVMLGKISYFFGDKR